MEEGPVWSSMKVRRSDAVADRGMLVTRTVVVVVVLSSIGIFPTEGKKVLIMAYEVRLVLAQSVLFVEKLATQLSLLRMNQITYSILFLLLTTFVQGLTKIQYLQNAFPFLRRVSDWSYINLISGYLPSLVLTVFLMVVPPLMMLFSTLEGVVSRSTRKRSACVKVLIFMFWNVYFLNILSSSWIERIGKLTVTRPKDLATLLAELIPRQPVGLIGNWLFKCVLMKEEDFVRSITFSYHTEFMNVYFVKYQIDGSYWPLAHNATIFALILTQVVAGILFGMKKTSTASTSTIPLIICTALFNYAPGSVSFFLSSVCISVGSVSYKVVPGSGLVLLFGLLAHFGIEGDGSLYSSGSMYSDVGYKVLLASLWHPSTWVSCWNCNIGYCIFSCDTTVVWMISWMGIGLDWMTNKLEDGNLVWGLLLSKFKKALVILA
ncbi:CSC1-like protein RXW8 [Tanacetum coccineum]